MNSVWSPWSHVRGLERLSLCDWPGKPSSVLFLGGCSLRCPTCHNADLAWRPETLPVVPRAEILSFLQSRRGWLDGIVVSGGEPTEIEDLPFLLRELSGLGLPIKLDTNGMRPEVVELLLGERLVRTFSVDVKGPYELYPQLTGGQVSADTAERNLRRIFALARQEPQAFLFRMTKVPRLSEADQRLAKGLLPSGFPLALQTYAAPRRMYAQTH